MNIISHPNLIKLIVLTLLGTSTIVKINYEFTGKFEVQTGVKEGDPLSATLFSIAMDSICWENDVKIDIQKLKVPNWKTLVQDRRRWNKMVGKAKILH